MKPRSSARLADVNADRAESRNDRTQILDHLSLYKQSALRVLEDGTWRGVSYPHILPRSQRHLNIVGPIREAFWNARAQKRWVLQSCFHHLSSSQALAFNLFFVCYPKFPVAFANTAAALGLPAAGGWHVDFEVILDPAEGTNIDVMIGQPNGARNVVEVKYTESGFGGAKQDTRRLEKLKNIYRPLLSGRVAESSFEPTHFFRNYQLYRNLAQLRPDSEDRLLLVLPRARRRLWDHATTWCRRSELGSYCERLNVVAVEDLIAALAMDSADQLAGAGYVDALGAKYGPASH